MHIKTNLKLQKFMKVRIIFIFITFIYYSSLSQIDSITQSKINYQANKFKYFLEMLYKYSLDTFDITNISDNAYSKLFTSVNPQSLYFNQQEYQKIEDQNRGTSHGIGVDLALLNDTLTIIKVVKNSPADSAGLKVGDKLLFIDGQSVLRRTKQFGDSLLKKSNGTVLNIIVRRFAENTWNLREFFVTAKDFYVPTVVASFILPGTNIGYVQISYFSEHTDEEFKKELDNLSKQGMKDLVIDLRGNPGGVVESATNCLKHFFPKNTKLLQVYSKLPELDTIIYNNEDGAYQHIRLAVLIDKVSASASEIFAGVIQDYDRGIVVGEQSFGKGTIQKIWKLTDSTGFRITVAEYYTPLGRSLQKNLDTTQKVQLDPIAMLNLGEKRTREIEEHLSKVYPRGNVKVFTTKNNRTLIQLGGILPDILVTSDTLNTLTRVLIQRGIFLEFAVNYFLTNGNQISKDYKNNFINFANKFEVDKNILDMFKQLSLSRNIWNENYYQQDFEYIKNYLKSVISYLFWQDNGYRAVFLNTDKTMKMAINSFNNYDNLLNINTKRR